MTFFPKTFNKVVTDAKLVAGPAIKNTNAAPIENPLVIIAKAIGMDAAAHTYIGILANNTNIIDKKLFAIYMVTNPSGINSVINAAINKPKIKVCPISFGNSYSPYF